VYGGKHAIVGAGIAQNLLLLGGKCEVHSPGADCLRQQGGSLLHKRFGTTEVVR